MKRWEHFNEMCNQKESLEEQALGMIISSAMEDRELGIYKENYSCYHPKFEDMKKWLNQEVDCKTEI